MDALFSPVAAQAQRDVAMHAVAAAWYKRIARAYRFKYGCGLNWEQELTKDLGVWGRLGWNDGHTESWAFTPIDRTAALGLALKGRCWCRPDDVVGLAGVLNGIAKDHRDYLAAGGLDFNIGDGALSYGLEEIIEVYYRFQIVKGMTVLFDFLSAHIGKEAVHLQISAPSVIERGVEYWLSNRVEHVVMKEPERLICHLTVVVVVERFPYDDGAEQHGPVGERDVLFVGRAVLGGWCCVAIGFRGCRHNPRGSRATYRSEQHGGQAPGAPAFRQGTGRVNSVLDRPAVRGDYAVGHRFSTPRL